MKSGELVIDIYAASEEPADDAVLFTELARLLRAREFDLVGRAAGAGSHGRMAG